MHLWLDPLFQNDFAASDDFLDVRTQFARLWIDDLKFFFDPQGKNVIFHRLAAVIRLSSSLAEANDKPQMDN